MLPCPVGGKVARRTCEQGEGLPRSNCANVEFFCHCGDGKVLGVLDGARGDGSIVVVASRLIFRRTREIAAASVPINVGAAWYSSTAVPVTSYVAQLSPMPSGARSKETWAINKLLRVPAAAFSAKMAGDLEDLGVCSVPSLSMRTTAALLRTALDGKMNFAIPMQEMAAAAIDNLTAVRHQQGLWWDEHWQALSSANNLWAASLAEIPGWKREELAAAVSAAVSRRRGKATNFDQWKLERARTFEAIATFGGPRMPKESVHHGLQKLIGDELRKNHRARTMPIEARGRWAKTLANRTAGRRLYHRRTFSGSSSNVSAAFRTS